MNTVEIILQICGGLGHSHRMSGITLLSVNDSKEFKKWNALSLPSVYRHEYVCAKFLIQNDINYYIFTAFRPKWRRQLTR